MSQLPPDHIPHPSRATPPEPPHYDPPVAAVLYDPNTGMILQSMRGLEKHIANSSPHYLVVPDYRSDWDVTHRVYDGILVPASSVSQGELDRIEAVKVRNKRDRIISDTDWVETPGARRRLSPDQQLAYENYRQALFDITTQAGFPHSIDWPKAP